MKSISIRSINGEIIQEIKYIDINDLTEILKLFIIHRDSDLSIHLLLNDIFINNFDIIDTSILLKLDNYNFITIVFSQKKELYCLNNINGKYILDPNMKDNYSKLLELVIFIYVDTSYDIIMNTLYKDLILLIAKIDGRVLEFISYELKNDRDIVLIAVKQHGAALVYASSDLQNDKEIVLEAVKTCGFALKYASINLQNDKEVVLKAIKENNFGMIILRYASINLQNDEEILLECDKRHKQLEKDFNLS